MTAIIPMSQEDKNHLLGELPLRPQLRRRVADWVASQVLADPQEELEIVTSKLFGLGFDIVEWPINSDGDLLLCYLGRLRHLNRLVNDVAMGIEMIRRGAGMNPDEGAQPVYAQDPTFDSFLISFAGHDSAQVTIYSQEDQWEV